MHPHLPSTTPHHNPKQDEDFDPASSASEEGSGNESDASSDGAEVVSEDDIPSAALRKVMEAEARPTKRKRG